MQKEFSLKTLAKVNEHEIVVIENSEQLVPVKPICEILGIAFEPQFTKLKNHPIFSSTVTINVTVGADGKDREMVCIPFKFLSGWLFSIDVRKVNHNVADAVAKFQLECFEVLDYHFRIKPLKEAEFNTIKLQLINSAYEEIEKGRSLKHNGVSIEKNGKLMLLKAQLFTQSVWEADNAQLTIPFTEVKTEEE
jgi:hypothetical protein